MADVVVDANAAAIEGGFGSERARQPGETNGMLGIAEQSVLAALHATASPIAPAQLIRELESAGFRNPEIRSAIWHLLDRHRIRLTLDLRLILPVAAVPSPGVAS